MFNGGCNGITVQTNFRQHIGHLAVLEKPVGQPQVEDWGAVVFLY